MGQPPPARSQGDPLRYNVARVPIILNCHTHVPDVKMLLSRVLRGVSCTPGMCCGLLLLLLLLFKKQKHARCIFGECNSVTSMYGLPTYHRCPFARLPLSFKACCTSRDDIALYRKSNVLGTHTSDRYGVACPRTALLLERS